MKKIFTLFSLLMLGAFAVQGQWTLSSSDFPTPGMNLTVYAAFNGPVGDSVTLGSAGASGSYTFGDLTGFYGDTMMLNFMSPASIGHGNTFSAAQVGYLSGWDIDNTDTTMIEYRYFKTTGNMLEEIGRTYRIDTAALLSGAPASGNLTNYHVNISPSDTVASSAFSVGYMHTDTSFWSAFVGNINHREGSRTEIHVDGSGMLHTAMGDYDVIRVKETDYRISQDYTSGVLTDEGYDTTYQFTFWAQNQGWPVAIVFTDETFTQVWEVEFLMGTPISVAPEFQIPFTVFPNPAMDHASIRFEVPTSADLRIDIINPIGQTIGNFVVVPAGYSEVTLPADAIGNGMYFIVLRNESGENLYSQPLRIQR